MEFKFRLIIYASNFALGKILNYNFIKELFKNKTIIKKMINCQLISSQTAVNPAA